MSTACYHEAQCTDDMRSYKLKIDACSKGSDKEKKLTNLGANYLCVQTNSASVFYYGTNKRLYHCTGIGELNNISNTNLMHPAADRLF